ncbi:MAG: hypothetical protein MJK04_00525, partial [Psychrosphaera sp.]|nr:hypothetical protein [Psychrosphaera sp.]
YRLNEDADRGLALKAITEAEADLLRRAEVGRLKAINVDDFDPQELTANHRKVKVVEVVEEHGNEAA